MAPKLSIADIDNQIASYQNSLLLFPRFNSVRIACVQNLAGAQFERYTLSQQKEDLDKAIVRYTEAIFLPLVSGAGPPYNVLKLLLLLASALIVRSKKFKRPQDIKYSINYLWYLRGQSLESFDVPRNTHTILLIQALAAQVEVESEAVDGTRNIKEIVVLCRELLNYNTSADLLIGAFQSLNQVIIAEFHRGRPIQFLDDVIECLRSAVKVCPPGSYDVLHALANTLCIRFIETHSNIDYEDATALLETILDPNQPGECPDSVQVQASSLVTLLACARSTIFKDPESSEAEISGLRALSSSSIGEELRFMVTQYLEFQTRQRFRRYDLAESLQEANACTSQSVVLSSSQCLDKSGGLFTGSDDVLGVYSLTAIQQKIQHLEVQRSNTPPGTENYISLFNLSNWYRIKFFRTNNVTDIEHSITYSRLVLDATHSNEPWRVNSLGCLRNILLLAFEHTNKIIYLDESITIGYDILKSKMGQHRHFQAIQQLVSSLRTRSWLLRRIEDLLEAIRLIPLAVDDQYTREPERFRLSCQWAFLARRILHPSVQTAYKKAMSLMRESLSFAPTVSIQHSRLVAMGEECQMMPLDYASYQIGLGRFEEAVETLEQGRTLLWSEMRGLRTPMAQLIEEDSPLENIFFEINHELEALTISITPSGSPEMGDDDTQGRDWTDPFGRLVAKRQKLVEELDVLISQIQGRPGLEGFLKTPSFTSLRSSASRGPVIIINHSKWRSDC